MKNKKIAASLIASVMLLTACSGGQTADNETDESSEAEVSAESSAATDETTEETAEETEPSSAYTMNDGYIVLGSYEQDGDDDNGPEPIEWEIISEEDGKIFVMSRYLLEWMPYNIEEAEVTWETCSIRAWLNNEFLNSAFSADDQAKILTTTVTTPDNPTSGVSGGNDTEDKVFLLSFNELLDNFEYEQFLENDGLDDFPAVVTTLTPYAQAKSNSEYNNRCMWWLRSPCGASQAVLVVDASGSAGWECGWQVHTYDMDGYYKFIRPAMYLEAE